MATSLSPQHALGLAVKTRRHELGLTQEQLAHAAPESTPSFATNYILAQPRFTLVCRSNLTDTTTEPQSRPSRRWPAMR
jgi:hypothetical protein